MMAAMERLSELTTVRYDELALVDAMRLIACHAASRGAVLEAREHFLTRWPRSLFAGAVRKHLTKAAIEPATTSDSAFAGSLLPPTLLQTLNARLADATVFQKMGAIPAPLNVPIAYAAAWPELQWVAEHGPKPATRVSLGSLTLQSAKGAGILVSSDELARLTDGRAEQIFALKLTQAATVFVDVNALDPALAAVAGVHPASLTQAATITVPAGGTPEADVHGLLAAFFAARPLALKPTFVVAPADVAMLVPKYPQLTVAGGTLAGYPAVVTPGATTLTLVDASGVFYYDGGVELDTSRDALIEMSDAPGTPSAATVYRDLWQHNEFGLRVDRFITWAAEPTAVATITAA